MLNFPFIYRKTYLKSVLMFLILVGISACKGNGGSVVQENHTFDEQRAYQDVVQQLEFGPRIPGSIGHQQTVKYIIRELKAAGWETEKQQAVKMGHPILNIVASRDSDQPYLLLGAHYDTRIHADRDPDPDRRLDPVPGANDGASGVAVLLELARTLPASPDVPVRLVFFDAEDNGSIPGWDWILGSRYYVEMLDHEPLGVVIVDMVGDKNLNLYREKNSTGDLQDQIWGVAHELGHKDTFLDEDKYSILDDHTPFLEQGIPAVDIIDFEYPPWHTTQDTLDQVSAHSLDVVGETLLVWLRGLTAADFE